MISFETIAFRNIGSYGDRAFEYDFRAAPITAFVGVNGSGKSTLLEALAFVLYGKSWRGVPKGELVIVHAEGFRYVVLLVYIN